MENKPKISPLVFYKQNQKTSTSGYDKYVFDSYRERDGTFILYYKNTRTKSTEVIIVTGVLNNVVEIHNMYFYNRFTRPKGLFFRTHIDYFKFYSNDNDTRSRFKHFNTEFQKVSKKYPEYFI